MIQPQPYRNRHQTQTEQRPHRYAQQRPHAAHEQQAEQDIPDDFADCRADKFIENLGEQALFFRLLGFDGFGALRLAFAHLPLLFGCRLLLLWADKHLRVPRRRPVAERNRFVRQFVLPAAAECPVGQRFDCAGKQRAEKLRFLHAPACFQRSAVEDFAPRIEQPFGADGDAVRALIDDFHRLPHRLR